jgi:hypothetical protein
LNKLKIMKQLYIFLLMLPAMLFAQTDIDFQSTSSGLPGTNWSWTADMENTSFAVVDNPYATGINTSTKVGELTAAANSNAWALAFSDGIGSFSFDATNTTVKIMVYKTRISPVEIKFEDASNSTINVSRTVSNTVTDAWEELSFDFYSAIGNTPYSKIVIIPDNSARSDANVTYFDNITFTAGVAPAGPSNSPAAPTKDAADVISVYSDAYTDIATNYNPGWGQAGSVNTTFDPGDGNNVMVYTDFNYQGTELTATDMAAMEYLHLDIWVESSDEAVYQVTPIGGGETLVNITTTPGSWSSVDIPLTSFTGVNFSAVNQMKFAGGIGNNIYLDNIYFWKEPIATGADASLSDLAIEGETVTGFGANTNYKVALTEGTTTVPQITSATTTDTNATSVITQATAIPGDATVVVTAANGTTTETYTVSFFIGKPAGAPATPTQDAADVISVYSDAYTDIATNYNPGWGQSGSVTTDYDAGDNNNILLYSNFNFQGTDLPPTDMTSMNFLHIDIWVAENETRVVKASPLGGGETLVVITTTPGSWNSVDIPLSSFTSVNFSAVGGMKFDGQFASDGAQGDTAIRSDIYLDNIYFYNDGSTDTGGGGDTTTYCETEVTHFNIDNHAGSIILTIENSGDDSITVTATSKDDVIDLLEISGIQGGGTTTGATIANGVATAEIIWGVGTMPATTTFQLMWSDELSPGNQMLNAGTGTDALGNIDTSNVCGTAGINEVNGFSVVTYPNPVENTLNVSAGDVVDSLTIFDLTGREVLRATPNAAAFSLDVSNLNKGLYLVTVKAGEQELNTKLVK